MPRPVAAVDLSDGAIDAGLVACAMAAEIAVAHPGDALATPAEVRAAAVHPITVTTPAPSFPRTKSPVVRQPASVLDSRSKPPSGMAFTCRIAARNGLSGGLNWCGGCLSPSRRRSGIDGTFAELVVVEQGKSGAETVWKASANTT